MHTPRDNAEDGSRKGDSDDSTDLALPGFGFGDLADMMRPFEKLVEPFSHSPMLPFAGFDDFSPAMDMQDHGDHYSITADLPGFEKKDVEVRVGPDSIEVKAEKSTEKEGRDDHGKFVRRSRSYFRRILALPSGVAQEKISGTMNNGVLELKLPKSWSKPRDRSRWVDLK